MAPDGLHAEMDDARRICTELTEILDVTYVLEAKSREEAEAVRRGTQQVGTAVARSGVNSGDLGNIILGAGIALAGHVIGNAFEAMGKAHAEAKREEARREVAEKKRALATEKITSLEKIAPRLEKYAAKFRKLLLSDTSMPLEYHALARHTSQQQGLSSLFHAYCENTLASERARYLFAQYEAWLAGREDGQIARPDPWSIQKRCAAEALLASQLPPTPSSNRILDQLTEGAVCLMKEPSVCEELMRDPGFRATVSAVANRRARGLVWPFSPESLVFRKLYGSGLGSSPVVRAAVNNRIYAVLAAGGMLSIGAGSFAVVASMRPSERIDAAIAAPDPCAVNTLAPDDLAKASEEQKTSVGQRAAACAATAESQRYDQSCSAVADGLGKGSLTPVDVAFLGDGANQLLRAQSRGLTADDLAVATAQMPCGRSSSAARLRASWIDDACQSVNAWAVAHDVAEDVIASLTDRRCEMPAEGKANFHIMAESAAKLELSVAGIKTDAGRAATTCKLDGQLGTPAGLSCRSLLARANKKLPGAALRPAAAAASSAPGVDPSAKRAARQECLRACIAGCHDDSSCERSCVAQKCPSP